MPGEIERIENMDFVGNRTQVDAIVEDIRIVPIHPSGLGDESLSVLGKFKPDDIADFREFQQLLPRDNV